jgi:hypothetical protein
MKKLFLLGGLCLSFSLMAQQPPIAKAPIAPVQKGVAVKPAAKVDEKKVELPKVPEKSFYQSFVEPLVVATKKEYQSTKSMRDNLSAFLNKTEMRYLRNGSGLYLLIASSIELNHIRRLSTHAYNHNYIKSMLYDYQLAGRFIGGVYLSAPIFARIGDILQRK